MKPLTLLLLAAGGYLAWRTYKNIYDGITSSENALNDAINRLTNLPGAVVNDVKGAVSGGISAVRDGGALGVAAGAADGVVSGGLLGSVYDTLFGSVPYDGSVSQEQNNATGYYTPNTLYTPNIQDSEWINQQYQLPNGAN